MDRTISEKLQECRDRMRVYNRKYWVKQAKRKSIRAKWSDLGIDEKRYRELQEIARSDKYADIVFASALKTDEKAAGHLIMSVTKGLSYRYLEYHPQLGRCPLGRTDFYGAKRLFFYYLNEALKVDIKKGGAA